MNPYADVFERMTKSAKTWSRSSAAERLERVQALQDALYEHRAEIGAIGLAETGLDGRASLVPLKPFIADLEANLARWMEPVEVAGGPALPGRRGFVRYQPKGVVLHLSTWNTPVLEAVLPMMAILTAGNTLVLKPSELAPRAAGVIRKVVETAGLTDLVEIVEGGPEVGAALLELPFHHISYIGGNKVGRMVVEASARHFAGVTLEMGGKNPVVVAADADLPDAARRIAHGRMILTGQACLGPDYVLVHDSVYDRFVQIMTETYTAFYDPEGEGFKASPAIGRIINEGHARRVGALIDDASTKGAQVLVGGDHDAAERWVAPTVLTGVTEQMDIFSEEVFGPVIAVQPYSSREEAVSEIEKRHRPLGFYVFTASPDEAEWWLTNTHAGSSAVNGIATQALVPNLPFGGANHSGIGVMNGQAAFQAYSNVRGVVVDEYDIAKRAPISTPPAPKDFDMGPILDNLIKPERPAASKD